MEIENLGNGLRLRHATPADATTLRDFNTNIHYPGLGRAVEIMVSGNHPLVKPTDFILIEDTSNNNKIASSAGILSHIWRYDGIPFDVGYLESVGTDEEYRQRGLMRRIVEAAHQFSRDKGQKVQMVGGIRWFYRRFGYEYALTGPDTVSIRWCLRHR